MAKYYDVPPHWQAFLSVFIPSCHASGHAEYGLHTATADAAKYGQYCTRPLVWSQMTVTAPNPRSLQRRMHSVYVHYGVWPDAPTYAGERFDRSDAEFTVWQAAAFASGQSLGKGVFVPMLSLFQQFDSATDAISQFESMSVAELLLHYQEPLPPTHAYSSFDRRCDEFDGDV